MSPRIKSWITPGSVTTALTAVSFVVLWYNTTNITVAQTKQEVIEIRSDVKELREDVDVLEQDRAAQRVHNDYVEKALESLLADRGIRQPRRQ